MAILSEAPAGANILDLGQARAARAEARAAAGEGNPLVKLTAGYVEVKPEFDIFIGELLMVGKTRDALTGLLVHPEDVDALIGEGLTPADLNAIVEFIGGVTLGEAQASSTP